MNRFARGALLLVVVIACARAPEPEGSAATVTVALGRARSCSHELGRLAFSDAAGVARAVGIAPVRLAPSRGTSEEVGAVLDALAERLEDVRAGAAAASALAALEEVDAARPRRSAERTRETLAAADALCVAAGSLRAERLARSEPERR